MFVDRHLTLNFFPASYLSDRGDTHHTHRASTVLVEHNLFGIDDGESEIEDEGDWHDDITSKETTCQATKRFEAMAVEVHLMQSEGTLLTRFFYREPHGRRTAYLPDLAARTHTKAETRWTMQMTSHLTSRAVVLLILQL